MKNHIKHKKHFKNNKNIHNNKQISKTKTKSKKQIKNVKKQYKQLQNNTYKQLKKHISKYNNYIKTTKQHKNIQEQYEETKQSNINKQKIQKPINKFKNNKWQQPYQKIRKQFKKQKTH